MQRELQKLDQFRQHLSTLQHELSSEKKAIAQTARQLQAASEALHVEVESVRCQHTQKFILIYLVSTTTTCMYI